MDRPAKKGLGGLADLALTFHQTQAQEGEIEKQTKILSDPAIDQKTRNMALFDRGFAYLLAEKNELAVADFTTLVESGQETEEEHAETLYNRARAFWHLNELARERDDLLAVTRLSAAPADLVARAHVQLGYSFGELEDAEQEAFHYNAAYEIEGASAEVRYDAKIRLARAYNAQSRFEDSEQILTALLAHEDIPPAQHVEALYYSAIVFDRLERPAEAILSYTAIIRLPEANNFDRSEAYYWRGHLYDRLERHEEAIRDFSAILRMEGLDPWTFTRTLYSRSSAYERLERTQEEIADLTRLIEFRYEPLDQRVEQYRVRAYSRRGYALKGSEQIDAALADFDYVLSQPEITPFQKADTLIDRGSTLAMADRFDEALGDLNKLLAMTDLPAESAAGLRSDALWYKALVLADMNRLAEALETLTELLAIDDTAPGLHLKALNRRGYHYYQLNRLDEAQADFQTVFEHAEATTGQRAYALTFFAEIDIDQGKPSQAREALTRVEQIDDIPDNHRARVCLLQGKAFEQEDEHTSAIEAYSRGLAFADVTPYTRSNLFEARADAYLVLEQEEAVITDYESALAVADLDSETFTSTLYSFGNAYYSLKKYDKAQACYRQTIDSPDIWPDLLHKALYAHALCYDRLEQYDQAVAEYHKLIAREDIVDEQEAEYLYSLAHTYGKAKDYEQSNTEYQKVIDHPATDPILKAKSIINSGIDFNRQFLGDQALARFAEVLAHNQGPDGWFARTHYQIASCYYYLGDFKRVIEEIEIVHAQEHIEDVDYAESFFFYGVALASQGRFEEALAQHEKTLTLEYEDVDEQAEVFLFRGITYKLMQKWDEALADYAQAIEIAKPDSYQHAVALRHQGEVLLRQGQKEAALKSLQTALAFDKLSPRDTSEANALLQELEG
ncbi:hypothetical protein DTL42_03655 [Bremerella cremea]|uniref:Tetratricopeptide repeat protein n=1 Tax=Bremerella cremea TaxID=1031537 RepID=A0A368KYC0_9BACT|nr:tetratricopeptide repeat protein [Bremerella cremea]RCS54252.1 hypothetical protein DTL42_03655 [Bremerella cremea]